ncbi:hypothetical protein H9P43_000097 [Blastocladiella emersonii ATCC 22665]|nr:hypothetical protein H9P43_000097 [Blastocladiella emersonii ATCC 22665]
MSSRAVYWNRLRPVKHAGPDAGNRVKPPVHSTYTRLQGSGLVLNNVSWSALPSDVLRALLCLPGLEREHIDYMIQRRSPTRLDPTGQWFVKFVPESEVVLERAADHLARIAITGQAITPYIDRVETWERQFITPAIGDATGRALLLSNLPIGFTPEDLFLTFRSFNIVPESSNGPPPVEILTTSTNSSIGRGVVRLASHDDAMRAIRECTNKLVFPKFARVKGVPGSRLVCSLLVNVVPVSGVPAGFGSDAFTRTSNSTGGNAKLAGNKGGRLADPAMPMSDLAKFIEKYEG